MHPFSHTNHLCSLLICRACPLLAMTSSDNSSFRGLPRNPFDIRRSEVLDAIDRLRAHVLKFATSHPDLPPPPSASSLLNSGNGSGPILRLRPRPRYDPLTDPDQEAEDAKHSVPIAEMGNYLEALKNQQTFRDPFSEDDMVNMSMFATVATVVLSGC